MRPGADLRGRPKSRGCRGAGSSGYAGVPTLGVRLLLFPSIHETEMVVEAYRGGKESKTRVRRAVETNAERGRVGDGLGKRTGGNGGKGARVEALY